MCDYSLHGHPTRLAQEGEQLVLAAFPGGTKGFTSRQHFTQHNGARHGLPPITWSIKGILDFLMDKGVSKPQPMTAVCIPPGAQLRLGGIPANLQSEWKVGEAEVVTFTQLSCSAHTHRDGVRFSSGKEVLLQRLQSGQTAVVLSLGADEEPFAVEAPSEETFERGLHIVRR